MKLKSVIVILTFLCVGLASQAQPYNLGIGIRGGYFSGITVKYFMGGSNALEGILSMRDHGYILTGLYLYENPISAVPNLYWDAGIGGHIGSIDRYYGGYWAGYDSDLVAGIDLQLGLEYAFKAVPFSIGLDWKPAYNLVGWRGFWGDDVAGSIRFTF